MSAGALLGRSSRLVTPDLLVTPDSCFVSQG